MVPKARSIYICWPQLTEHVAGTPHSSFQDPTAPKDAPLRESIEVMAVLYYRE